MRKLRMNIRQVKQMKIAIETKSSSISYSIVFLKFFVFYSKKSLSVRPDHCQYRVCLTSTLLGILMTCIALIIIVTLYLRE